jgi:hypothetical protein
METWSSRLWLEHRATNPVSIKKEINATEISAAASDEKVVEGERRGLVVVYFVLISII